MPAQPEPAPEVADCGQLDASDTATPERGAANVKGVASVAAADQTNTSGVIDGGGDDDDDDDVSESDEELTKDWMPKVRAAVRALAFPAHRVSILAFALIPAQ